MSDALIVALLAGVAVVTAVLSFLAWHRVGRQPDEEANEPKLDSDDPAI